MKKKFNIAIVGLGFGAEFIPIYQRHPNSILAAICQRTQKKLDLVGDAFGVEKRYADFETLIKDPEIDAVHINSPIPDHGPQTLKALKAGKVGSMSLAVPIATFKSREGGLDDNAAKALKAADNPEIRFDLTKEKLTAGATEGSYVLTATGTLPIAGDTEPVTLSGDANVTDNQIRFKGVQKLKMTDFKITPPSISLVVTAITCTDDITVYYDVIFGAK